MQIKFIKKKRSLFDSIGLEKMQGSSCCADKLKKSALHAAVQGALSFDDGPEMTFPRSKTFRNQILFPHYAWENRRA